MVAPMKLYEGRATTNLVRSYDADGITIGAERHSLPLLVTATRIEASLEGRTLATLTERDLALILDQQPDLVLAGSAGAAPRAPPTLRSLLENRRIAIESMQLGAACRTFNVLLQEDRAVLALLLP